MTVETTYTVDGPDGNAAALTAKNPDTGDQTTYYVYGVSSADGSDLATSELLRATIYPDSTDGADQVSYTYNRQGQPTTVTDQNDTVHAFDYDLLGRAIHDRVTTVGSGVDSSILRTSTTYEVRGMVETVTSYDNATESLGTAVNQVEFDYNDFAQLVTDKQEHEGTVDGFTFKVQYAYVDGTGNTIRPTSVTYPNNRVLTFDYGLSTDENYKLSRVETLDWAETDVSTYTYLGLGTIVKEEYVASGGNISLNYMGSDNTYSGFDRFGRVDDQRWSAATLYIDRFRYGYDRNGNRTYRENVKAEFEGVHLDELYSYDGLNRLKTANRGQLNFEQTKVPGANKGSRNQICSTKRMSSPASKPNWIT